MKNFQVVVNTSNSIKKDDLDWLLQDVFNLLLNASYATDDYIKRLNWVINATKEKIEEVNEGIDD